MKNVMRKALLMLVLCVVGVAVMTQTVQQQMENEKIENRLQSVSKDPYTYRVNTGYFRIITAEKSVEVQYNNVTSICDIRDGLGHALTLKAACYKCGWTDSENIVGNVTRTCKCGNVHFTIDVE